MQCNESRFVAVGGTPQAQCLPRGSLTPTNKVRAQCQRLPCNPKRHKRTRAYACVGPVGYPSLVNPSKAGGLCLSFPGDIGPSTKCILSSNAAHFCHPAAPACHREMRSLQLACSSAVSAKAPEVRHKCICEVHVQDGPCVTGGSNEYANAQSVSNAKIFQDLLLVGSIPSFIRSSPKYP